ncbi:hypothetical protein [Candidatus Chlamydia corallus]|uniref:hypothetical protein n=1 Tax=Candidatus Chlamydia corallus TaxID=2038470 RepID=UPI000C2FEF77|nr:hypothetical protein [Candidatus Chlamydia corallus]
MSPISASTPSTTTSPVKPQPPLVKSEHRYCSWAFFKPVLISLGLLLASLATLGLVIASGVALSLGIGIVLAIQIGFAAIALILLVNHIRQFRNARSENMEQKQIKLQNTIDTAKS